VTPWLAHPKRVRFHLERHGFRDGAPLPLGQGRPAHQPPQLTVKVVDRPLELLAAAVQPAPGCSRRRDELLDAHGTTLRDEAGIGPIAAATLLVEVDDPFRFARESVTDDTGMSAILGRSLRSGLIWTGGVMQDGLSSSELAPPVMEPPMPEVAGVRHRTVVTPRLRMHVAEAGTGAPVVLLHDWPEHWYAWRRLVPLLARRCRLIAPDLRGAGWSVASHAGYRTVEQVDDLIALINTLGLERVVLVGQGRGGWIGFHACLRAPERFTAFVALNSPHPYLRARHLLAHAWRYWYTALLETPYVGRLVVRHVPWFTRLVLRLAGRRSDALSPEEVATYVACVRRAPYAAAAERLYRAVGYREVLPMLAGRGRSTRLVVPTVALAGSRDWLLPPSAHRGFEGHADAMRLDVVEGAGHLLAEERPEVVATAVQEALAVAAAA
jgi:pimeloyl-ACP methyl ester carboxylesterase